MEPVHIYKQRSETEANFLINIIPVVVFVISLAVVLIAMHGDNKLTKGTDSNVVLGGYTQNSK